MPNLSIPTHLLGGIPAVFLMGGRPGDKWRYVDALSPEAALPHVVQPSSLWYRERGLRVHLAGRARMHAELM